MHWRNVISELNTTAEYLVKPRFRDEAEEVLRNTARSVRICIVGDFSLLGTVHEYEILDGQAFRNRVWRWATPGLWIDGANVVRYLLDQLGVEQPERLTGETCRPNIAALRKQVADERAEVDAERKRQEEEEEQMEREYQTRLAEEQKRTYFGTPSNYDGLDPLVVEVLRKVERAAQLHTCGYPDDARCFYNEAVALRAEYDSEITALRAGPPLLSVFVW